MPELDLDYCWECPKCGAQIGQVSADAGMDFILSPPTCTSWAHLDEPTEMEQRSAERWGRQWETT
jgi:hypothetical protein